MDRRLVIMNSLLILALAALMAGGLFGPAGAPAADQAAWAPQPAPRDMGAPPPAAAARDDAAVTAHHLAPAGMSGEFSKRLYAYRDAPRAPVIHLPCDTWSPRGSEVRSRHHTAPNDGGAAATRVA